MVLDLVMPYVLPATRCLPVFVSVVFFISGFDDFFIDTIYIIRAFYRRLYQACVRKNIEPENPASVD